MDKKQKKALRNQWQAEQRADAVTQFPLPSSELKALFDMLDVALPVKACDHSRRLTIAWLESRGHDVEKVCEWLDETGGYCDCEVLMNSEEAYQAALGWPNG